MDASLCFRRSLVARWIPLLGLTLSACGSNVVVDSTGANGGGGHGGDGAGTSHTTASGTKTNTDTGDNGPGGYGGYGAQGGFSGDGGFGGFGGNTGGQGGTFGLTEQCFDPPPPDPDEPQCPPIEDAYMYVSTGECGWIESGPSVNSAGQCCYLVYKEECGKVGRPYLVDGRSHTAAAHSVAASAAATAREAAASWSEAGALRPDVAGLTGAQRATLADAWAKDGLLEHASVASFGRFALELLAAGAPAALVADAHRAALDEVRHARLCFGLASTYAAETIAPGPFDFGRGVPVDADLARIAARTFLEGCVGETLAAVQAVEQRAAAEDPAVRAVLAVIAEDEARHAELAWRTVAWALRAGGEPVREALRAALSQITAGIGDTPPDATLRAHGRLDTSTLRASVDRTVRDVILPCARGLLAQSRAEQAPAPASRPELRAA